VESFELRIEVEIKSESYSEIGFMGEGGGFFVDC